MRFSIIRPLVIGLATGASLLAGACDKTATPVDTTPTPAVVSLANYSTTPALVKNVMAGVTPYSLVGSDDAFPATPSFIFGGSIDGMGLMKDPTNGAFKLYLNNEDNFSVAEFWFEGTMKPAGGRYILNSTGGGFRLCSATLATPEEHGFGPLFLTAGESSEESMIRAVTPGSALNTSVTLPALGRWNGEQALPLPKTAYTGKTVIIVGDDDSNTQGGQVVAYVSNTVGDLENGSLYMLARTDNNQRERDMVLGQTYPVVFRQINNQKTLTGNQINALVPSLQAIRFGRVEDVDYRRVTGSGREVYFAVTGQAFTGVNADSSRTKYGRIYRLILSTSDPLAGTLEVVLDGDVRPGVAAQFQNPDNVTVTQNYVYIQEDPNGYGDEGHDARIYQYNIATKALTIVLELDQRRGEAKYNVGQAGNSSAFGAWEVSGLIDISDVIGQPDVFLVGVQAHTWTGAKYQNPDGGTIRTAENQASQLLALRGLPR